MMEVRGKRVLVVGLGRSGQAVALCLAQRGAVVTVTDTKPPAAFGALLPALMAQRIGLELGQQRLESFLARDLVVLSPGVPWDLPQLQAARERGISVVPEIEVAGWFLHHPIVGITGSNGKTTTTLLLGKMLEASGFRTFVGGNVGVALSSAVDQMHNGAIVVAELSSFQLEAIQGFRPHVAVLLNLSPNHLDRHPSLEAYAQAKRQIFRNQRADDYAVLNADDPWVLSLSPALASHKVFFTRSQQIVHGVLVSNGNVVYRTGHLERVLFETREVRLRGAFNLEDVLAAAAAACLLGADFDAVRRAVREFKGVEHRLEYVREIGGVEFYNNSKATSVDATAKSLEAFERGVHLILGGKDKGAPYAPLRPLMKDRVRNVLLIGAAADRIAEELAGAVEIIRAGTLENAVLEAYQSARPGDVVLLAPACSSFDQFQDYEERGRFFKEQVGRLASYVTAGAVVWNRKVGQRITGLSPVVSAPSPDRLPAEATPKEPQLRSTLAAEPSPKEVRVVPAQPAAGPTPAAQPPAPVSGPPLLLPGLALVYEVKVEEFSGAEAELADERPEMPGAAPATAPPERTADAALPYERRERKRAGAAGRSVGGLRTGRISSISLGPATVPEKGKVVFLPDKEGPGVVDFSATASGPSSTSRGAEKAAAPAAGAARSGEPEPDPAAPDGVPQPKLPGMN